MTVAWNSGMTKTNKEIPQYVCENTALQNDTTPVTLRSVSKSDRRISLRVIPAKAGIQNKMQARRFFTQNVSLFSGGYDISFHYIEIIRLKAIYLRSKINKKTYIKFNFVYICAWRDSNPRPPA